MSKVKGNTKDNTSDPKGINPNSELFDDLRGVLPEDTENNADEIGENPYGN